jgi:hypothetical protein
MNNQAAQPAYANTVNDLHKELMIRIIDNKKDYQENNWSKAGSSSGGARL